MQETYEGNENIFKQENGGMTMKNKLDKQFYCLKMSWELIEAVWSHQCLRHCWKKAEDRWPWVEAGQSRNAKYSKARSLSLNFAVGRGTKNIDTTDSCADFLQVSECTTTHMYNSCSSPPHKPVIMQEIVQFMIPAGPQVAQLIVYLTRCSELYHRI